MWLKLMNISCPYNFFFYLFYLLLTGNRGLEYVTITSWDTQGCWIMGQNQVLQTVLYKCYIKMEWKHLISGSYWLFMSCKIVCVCVIFLNTGRYANGTVGDMPVRQRRHNLHGKARKLIIRKILIGYILSFTGHKEDTKLFYDS